MKYREVSSRVHFPDLEHRILNFWEADSIFKISADPSRYDKSYTFYDGPPFATGLPHYGHLLASIIKDIVPRYWAMKGYYVERRFGWDCHGLPIEHEIDKKLGMNAQDAVAKLGVKGYCQECRGIVDRYTAEWEKTIKRIGRWVDFDNDYKTMDPEFMESVWWVFKSLWDKDLIYQGTKVVPFSTALGTVLSNFEAGDNYQDVQDPAVTVLFKADDEDAYFAAWTTTPWTLPSNLALCVCADVDYVKLNDEDTGKTLYMAKARVEAYSKKRKLTILEELKGSDLKGRGFEPLFPFFAKLKEEGAFVVLNDDYVGTESGTGIVHIAPAFGEDDNRVMREAGIKALVCPVDNSGKFTPDVTDWAGEYVKDADKGIIRSLREAGQLYEQSTIQHSYPFCPRSDTPLIYKAIPSWYVKVEEIKERIIAANDQIYWVPDHLKKGRFGKWLEGARDWAISRNRVWGTPLPIWQNETTGSFRCVGSIEELETLSGVKVDDLHREHVDDIEFSVDGEDGTYKRITEVLDCWFESGSMPYAQQHYPFENKERFEANFPADFIAEGLDQTRGWFYTLTVLGAALFDKPAFKNVVVNGLILAEDGKKMSKRLKNYPDPSEVMEKFGADALRLYLINSPVVRAQDLRFSEEGIGEMMRQVLLPLWNSYSFFVTYANIDGWKPSAEPVKPTHEMDRWVISRLQTLIKEVNEEMQAYHLWKVVDNLVDFIDDLTNWYIRRSRRRFWKSEDDGDKNEAYQTLYTVLVDLAHLLAPMLPFLSEEIWDNLVAQHDDDAIKSIHLRDYPEYDDALRDETLESEMAKVMTAVELGRSLRSQHNLKVRQPLGEMTLISSDSAVKTIAERYQDVILSELNIKSLTYSSNETELVNLNAKPNFKALAPRYGKFMKAIAPQIAAFTSEDIVSVQNGGTKAIDIDGNQVELTADDLFIQRECKEGFVIETAEGITVAIDTNLNDELVREGTARELVNRIQNMRKEAGYRVEDRIELVIQSADDVVNAALQAHGDYVKSETLCENLTLGDTSLSDAFEQNHDIDDKAVSVKIKKV